MKNTVNALLSPPGGYLFSSRKKGGPIGEGGLIEGGGGGGGFITQIFKKIHINFSNFTITPLTKTEQEMVTK